MNAACTHTVERSVRRTELLPNSWIHEYVNGSFTLDGIWPFPEKWNRLLKIAAIRPVYRLRLQQVADQIKPHHWSSRSWTLNAVVSRPGPTDWLTDELCVLMTLGTNASNHVFVSLSVWYLSRQRDQSLKPYVSGRFSPDSICYGRPM